MITAPEGRCIIAVGPMCWGKGKTSIVALRNARKEMPGYAKRPASVRLIEAPEDAYLNEMGGLCYKEGEHRDVGTHQWK